MEKTSDQLCPRCGRLSLSVYYSDESDLKLGAVCGHCRLKGYYSNGRLVTLATA